MKKAKDALALALLGALLLLLPAIAFAGIFEEKMELEGKAIKEKAWFADWKPLGMFAVTISLLIVALAYMIGYSFELRDLLVWAKSEFAQIVVSLLIMGALIGIVGFIDGIAQGEAVSSLCPPSAPSCQCEAGRSCSLTIAQYYVDNLLEITKKLGKNLLGNSESYAREASVRSGIYSNLQTLLWFGTISGKNAGLSMMADRSQDLFDMLSKMAASLAAQRYFLALIEGSLGPVLILLGIVLRSFHISRKVGGMLLAAGITLFVVYPLFYVLAWYTLKVTVYGDEAITPEADCQYRECLMMPPAVVLYNKSATDKLTNYTILEFSQLNKTQRETLRDINPFYVYAVAEAAGRDGFAEVRQLQASGIYTISCSQINDSVIGWNSNAVCDIPLECREFPFPIGLGCDEQGWNVCSNWCKITRYRTDCIVTCPEESCPSECKVELPYFSKLATDSAGGTFPECAGCADCPNFCRIEGRAATGDCDTCGDCPSVCRTAMPAGGLIGASCNSLCSSSKPDYCRVIGGSSATGCGGAAGICSEPSCLATPPRGGKCADYAAAGAGGSCSACPAQCRLSLSLSAMFIQTEACVQEECDMGNIDDVCKSDCMAEGGATEADCNRGCCLPKPKPQAEQGCFDPSCVSGCKVAPPTTHSTCPAGTPGVPAGCDPSCTDASLGCIVCTTAPTPAPTCCKQYDPISDARDGKLGNCVQCPLECRWKSDAPGYCTSDAFSCEAAYCPDDCKLGGSPPPTTPDGSTTCAGAAGGIAAVGGGLCEKCPSWCRLNRYVPGCENYDCYGETCTAECKASIPAGPCDNCLGCPSDCTTIPQVRTDCDVVCGGPREEMIDFDPKGFVAKMFGEGGAAGSRDTKMIGVFAIPAIVLPLFNIVMAVSLIRILSPFLGGDIEIPGLARLI